MLGELSGSELTAIGGATSIVLTFLGKLIWDVHDRASSRIDVVEFRLQKCQDEHADCREEAAGMREALKTVAKHAGPAVAEKVEQKLAEVDERKMARKTSRPSDPPPEESGTKGRK